MADVRVDTEKLAYGLKLGIGDTDTIFADGPFQNRLRYTACGLVSSAIHQYCQVDELPSRLLISSPNLPFDPDMQHVVPVIGESPADGIVVDASYSQFLGYVGLNLAYQERAREVTFPDEEIITFKFSERQITMDWLTDTTVKFKPRRTRPPAVYEDDVDYKIGAGPLSGADKSEIIQIYSAIWDPANMRVWEPPQHVIAHGKTAAARIPPGAITYS